MFIYCNQNDKQFFQLFHRNVINSINIMIESHKHKLRFDLIIFMHFSLRMIF